MKPPETRRDWIRCTYCGAKASAGLYGNHAVCSGVYTKCTRGCGKEFEIIIKDGEQIFPARKSNCPEQ